MAETSFVQERDLALERAVLRAKTRWPGIGGSAQDLIAHVRRLRVASEDLARFGDELHLACACLHRDRVASRVLERDYVGRICSTMVRLGRDQDFGDEVSQLLRERILIPPEPRLERYAGRAPLFAWLRRVARRIALNVLRTRRRRATDPLLPEHWVQRPCEEASEFPRYLRVVNAAAERALERLATRDVDLLRLHYVSGLNIEQLGQLRNVHRATIARWLVDIRLRIRNDIRRDVRAILKLEGSDCDALFELLLADIDEEFSGLLAAATPDGGSRAGEP